MISRRPILCWFAALLCCVGGIGCGKIEPYHAVTGRITLDGQPLADADVSFVPEGGAGVASLGRTDAQGVYQLQHTQTLLGAPVGDYRVRVSTLREAKENDETARTAVPERVPPRYNLASELTVRIEPGENTLNFTLETAGRR